MHGYYHQLQGAKAIDLAYIAFWSIIQPVACQSLKESINDLLTKILMFWWCEGVMISINIIDDQQGCLNIKMASYLYRDHHDEHKMAVWYSVCIMDILPIPCRFFYIRMGPLSLVILRFPNKYRLILQLLRPSSWTVYELRIISWNTVKINFAPVFNHIIVFLYSSWTLPLSYLDNSLFYIAALRLISYVAGTIPSLDFTIHLGCTYVLRAPPLLVLASSQYLFLPKICGILFFCIHKYPHSFCLILV